MLNPSLVMSSSITVNPNPSLYPLLITETDTDTLGSVSNGFSNLINLLPIVNDLSNHLPDSMRSYLVGF